MQGTDLLAHINDEDEAIAHMQDATLHSDQPAMPEASRDAIPSTSKRLTQETLLQNAKAYEENTRSDSVNDSGVTFIADGAVNRLLGDRNQGAQAQALVARRPSSRGRLADIMSQPRRRGGNDFRRSAITRLRNPRGGGTSDLRQWARSGAPITELWETAAGFQDTTSSTNIGPRTKWAKYKSSLMDLAVKEMRVLVATLHSLEQQGFSRIYEGMTLKNALYVLKEYVHAVTKDIRTFVNKIDDCVSVLRGTHHASFGGPAMPHIVLTVAFASNTMTTTASKLRRSGPA